MPTLYEPIPVAATTYTSDSYTNGSVPASFDAFLYKPFDRGQLKLTIKLRLKLRPLAPRLIPLALDADDKPFWTSPWTRTDWQRFIGAATAQVDLWNNRFWLQPPTTFSQFDQVFDTFPTQAYRPNIRCELVVDFDPKDNAHRTIDIANLNTGLLTGQAQDPGTFRSHSLLWDSLDGVPWAFPYGSGPNRPAKHYVIAHEIGHLLGLGHIGTILKTPLCVLAMTAKDMGLDHDANMNGGRNSFYCYGKDQGISVVGNIMGAGGSFTIDNAMPWLWAIMSLRKRPYEAFGWRVALSDPGPASWVARSK